MFGLSGQLRVERLALFNFEDAKGNLVF